MLVSGVWRLWLTPRRKSSLAASSSSSWAFWASTWANSWALRIATAISLANSSRRSWSAALPAPGRRQVADEDAESRPRRGGGPPGRAATRPGTPSSTGTVAGSTEHDRGVDHPERGPGVAGRAAGDERPGRRAASRSRSPRGSGRARGCAARGRAARRLWLSARRASSSSPGDDDRRREVAGGRPLDGAPRSPAAAR